MSNSHLSMLNLHFHFISDYRRFFIILQESGKNNFFIAIFSVN